MVNGITQVTVAMNKECPYCRENHNNDFIEYKQKYFCCKDCLKSYKKAEKFIGKYRDDFILFAEEFMGIELKAYQKLLLRRLSKADRPVRFTMTRR